MAGGVALAARANRMPPVPGCPEEVEGAIRNVVRTAVADDAVVDGHSFHVLILRDR